MKQLLIILFFHSFVHFNALDCKLLKEHQLFKPSSHQVSAKQIIGNKLEIFSILNNAEEINIGLGLINSSPECKVMIESMPRLKPQLRPP